MRDDIRSVRHLFSLSFRSLDTRYRLSCLAMSYCPVRLQPRNGPMVLRWSVGGQIYHAVWKAIADPGRLPVQWEERPKAACFWFPLAAESCMAKYLWISDMTTDPSPTADATRLT